MLTAAFCEAGSASSPLGEHSLHGVEDCDLRIRCTRERQADLADPGSNPR